MSVVRKASPEALRVYSLSWFCKYLLSTCYMPEPLVSWNIQCVELTLQQNLQGWVDVCCGRWESHSSQKEPLKKDKDAGYVRICSVQLYGKIPGDETRKLVRIPDYKEPWILHNGVWAILPLWEVIKRFPLRCDMHRYTS